MKITVVIFTGVLILASCREQHVKKLTGLEGKPIPEFEIVGPDISTRVSTKNVTPGKAALLFSFEPWCPYSRAQTKDLIEHIKMFKDIEIYMFCNAPFPKFQKFVDEYKLRKYKNIHPGVITDFTFYKYINTAKIPLIAVYDNNQNLKEVVVGNTDVDVIKRIASN